MQAIIVAGGKGERLRPITDKIPKPMVEVKGKTILEHTISLLKNNGVTDLILALCYLPEVIVEHFGNGEKFGVNIKYTFEDPKNPLGTAGAIRESKKWALGLKISILLVERTHGQTITLEENISNNR